MSIDSVMPSSHLILCRPFSSCPQSFPASGSFPMSWLFASGGQSTGASASRQSFQWWLLANGASQGNPWLRPFLLLETCTLGPRMLLSQVFLFTLCKTEWRVSMVVLSTPTTDICPHRQPFLAPLHVSVGLSFYCYYYFCPCCATCRNLVPRPGIEPGPLVVKALSPNHWMAWASLSCGFYRVRQPFLIH